MTRDQNQMLWHSLSIVESANWHPFSRLKGRIFDLGFKILRLGLFSKLYEPFDVLDVIVVVVSINSCCSSLHFLLMFM